VVIDSLAEAASKAASAGVTLLVENGQGSWADTGAASCAILDAVHSPALRMTWDPANVTYGGFAEDPVGEGYPRVRPYVRNVHVKDAVCAAGKGKWVALGEGRVDWKAQITALRADGYDGFLTAEPHLQYESPVGLVGKTETFLANLRALAG
jgi:sugar phosphate isomerase/epimerase